MDHHQRIRLVVRLGIKYGYRSVVTHHHGENSRFPGNMEDLYVISQNAGAETENR